MSQHSPDFRALFEKAPGSYLILTPDLEIVAVTDAYLDATLTKREQILGRHLFEMFSDNMADPEATGVRNLSASLERVLKLKKPDAMAVQRYDVSRPGGGFEPKYWSPLNSPVLDEQGNVQYIVHQVEDVTEIVRLHQSAERALSTTKRQQREIDTLRQATLFQILVKQVKDYAILMLDAQGRVATWNEGAQRLKGYTEEEIIGQPYSTFFPPEAVRAGDPERLLQTAVVRGSVESEGWRIGKGGKRFWAQATVTALRDEHGRLVGFAKVTRDLTEHKQAEEALRRSEQMFRRIFESDMVAISFWRPDGEVLDANRAWLELLDYTRDEIARRQVQWTSLVAPEHRAAVSSALEEAIAHGTGPIVEVELVRKDGRRLPVLLGGAILDEARTIGASFILDLTGQKAAEAALTESEDRYRRLVELSPEAVMLDKDRRIVYSNPAGAKLLAATAPEDIVGRSLLEFIHPDDLTSFQSRLEQARREGKTSIQIEERLIRLDGTTAFIETTTSPFSHQGQPMVMAQIQDVTERRHIRELENRVKARTAELEATLRALRDTEYKFRSIIENTDDIVYLKDLDGRFILINRAGSEQLGRRPGEIVGLRDVDLVGVEYGRQIRKNDQATIAAGALQRFEERSLESDGTEHVFLSTKYPYMSPAGEILGIIGISRDITDRKRMEVELRRLAAIVKSSTDSIIGLNPDGTIISWNDGAKRLYGYTAEEMIGQPIGRIVQPERTEELRHALDRLRRGDSITNFETRRVRKDGRVIDVSVNASPIKNEQGRVIGIATLGRDITEQKRASERLAASEARFRTVLESAPDAAVIVNQQGTITLVNAQAERSFGYSRDDLIGSPVEILMPERFRAVHSGHIGQFYAYPHSRPMGVGLDLYGLHKDGTEFPIEISLSPMEAPEGTLIIASIRDVTERKRAMEALILRTVELKKAQELNQLKDHFLSTISHEMKTPLALITGYTELLEDLGPSEEIILGLKDGTRRLTEHIEQILDYSALLSDTLPLYMTDVNLEEVAQHVAEIVHDRIQQKRIAFETEIDPQTPEIQGDFRRIVQMITELVDNAVKFTQAGGRLGLRISPHGGRVRIDVWDSGPGIPEADFLRIWEAFSQLEIGNAVRKGGLGLGLTIIKKLAELHGGQVGVVSLPGQGSTFSIFLPIRASQRQVVGPPELPRSQEPL